MSILKPFVQILEFLTSTGSCFTLPLSSHFTMDDLPAVPNYFHLVEQLIDHLGEVPEWCFICLILDDLIELIEPNLAQRVDCLLDGDERGVSGDLKVRLRQLETR